MGAWESSDETRARKKRDKRQRFLDMLQALQMFSQGMAGYQHRQQQKAYQDRKLALEEEDAKGVKALREAQIKELEARANWQGRRESGRPEKAEDEMSMDALNMSEGGRVLMSGALHDAMGNPAAALEALQAGNADPDDYDWQSAVAGLKRMMQQRRSSSPEEFGRVNANIDAALKAVADIRANPAALGDPAVQQALAVLESQLGGQVPMPNTAFGTHGALGIGAPRFAPPGPPGPPAPLGPTQGPPMPAHDYLPRPPMPPGPLPTRPYSPYGDYIQGPLSPYYRPR
jgi:hypothetical protein